MLVAVAGLLVNLFCALVLGQAGTDHPGHEHGHDHPHHHDLNLRSAYVHVLADAATSVLAIAALAGGMAFGWSWLDPVMGLAGAVLVAVWAWGLIRSTTRVLLDAEMTHPVVAEIREAIAADPEWGAVTLIQDLHVWRVGRGQYACILALATSHPDLTVATVRQCLSVHEEVAHLTVEIHGR